PGGRVREAHEPLALEFEELHDRCEALLARSLRDAHLVHDRRLPPGCRARPCHAGNVARKLSRVRDGSVTSVELPPRTIACGRAVPACVRRAATGDPDGCRRTTGPCFTIAAMGFYEWMLAFH